MRRPKGFIELSLFKKIINDVKTNGHKIDCLHHFGEPLLYPHLIEAIQYMTDNGIHTEIPISTNGLLLTPQLADQLYKAGLRSILVAIDTLIPEAYRQLRGGNVEVIKKNMHDVVNNTGLVVHAQLMPSKYNIGENEASFYNEFGRRNFQVLPWFVIRMDGADNASTNLSHKPSEVNKTKCDKLYERVVIMWNGITALCCLDMNGELETGNLNLNTINESFSGTKANSLRHKIRSNDLPDLCRRCYADHIILHNIQ
jgi:sulfatase maturation enzyme AslB (radical SAM superfamily)